MLICFISFLFTNNLFAQSNPVLSCGTSNTTPTENFDPGAASVASTGISAILPNVPVWIYLISTSNGSSVASAEEAMAATEGINQYFLNVCSFSVCGMTNIVSDDFYEVHTSQNEHTQLFNYINGLPETSDDKCVKIVFLGSIYIGTVPYSGYSFIPQTIPNSGIFLNNTNPKVIAHEMGHYFRLSHTDGLTNTNAMPTVFPLSPAVLAAFPPGTEPKCFDFDYGDGICDTPADPGSCEKPGCLVDCGNKVDPFGVPYTPDLTLLMRSAISDCLTHFSEGQEAYMRYKINEDPIYADLTDPSNTCIQAKDGTIIAHCMNGSQNIIMPNLFVKVVSTGSTQCTTSTTVSGKYPINTCSQLMTRTVQPQRENDITQPNVPQPAYLDLLNGVTAYDLVLISRHIKNLEPLNTPYKFIAADINNSGTITTFDNVLLRQALLGTTTSFPGNTSWRYLPNVCLSDYHFVQDFIGLNPFIAQYTSPFLGFTKLVYNVSTAGTPPSNFTYASWMDELTLSPLSNLINYEFAWSFTGIKIGDVNCSADPNELVTNNPTEKFVVNTGNSTNLNQGYTKNYDVVVVSPEPVAAWQVGMAYKSDSLDIAAISQGNSNITLTSDNFFKNEDGNTNSGMFRSLWFSETGTPVDLNNKIIFTLSVNAEKSIDALEDRLVISQKNLKKIFFNEDGQEIHGVKLYLQEESHDRNENIANYKKIEKLLVQVSPNPFKSELIMTINNDSKEEVNIEFFDISGNKTFSSRQEVSNGKSVFEFSQFTSLPSGLYIYTVSTANQRIFGKIIKE